MIDVVFISSCRKRAIVRTHAILDRYASRMGNSTWTTKITAEGLETVRRALRRTASRNTAVLCMKRDGRGPRARMRQAWVVGHRAFFGSDWKTPVFVTESTTRSRTADRSAPAWVGDARRVAAVSGLFHDLGKNNKFFAKKILSPVPIADPIRHEWLSTCLITTMLKTPNADLDQAWNAAAASAKNKNLDKSEQAFFPEGVHGPLQAVLACVATHHRLYEERAKQSSVLGPDAFLAEDQTGSSQRSANIAPELNLEMDKPYPDDIRQEVARAMKWLASPHEPRHDYWRAVTIIARTGLILADHKVSSEVFSGKTLENEPYANTRNRKLNQPLRWHLQSVGRLAAAMVDRMMNLENDLDGLDAQAIDSIDAPAVGRFAWQQTAADAIAEARSQSPASPMLINLVAGTGSGKTLACARLAVRAARGDKVRFATLLNLRTLTLQTGAAYSSQLGISDSDLAVVIGDTMTRKAFEAQQNADRANEDGMVRDFGEDIQVRGEPALLPDWLEHFIADKVNLRAMISAPVLVSTADYMISAAEPGAQTRHIMPLLRLLSSDLVLDEIDNYDSGSIVAILRLIQMAALLGRNVIASSATLTPTLARAIVRFYEYGARMRASLIGSDQPDFMVATLSDMAEPVVEPFTTVEAAVKGFSHHVDGICATLRTKPAHPRKAIMQPVEKSEQGFVDAVARSVMHLHERNAWESDRHGPGRGKRLSVGLVRVANIQTAVCVARFLRENLAAFKPKVVCYHSNLFHGHRLVIERALDRMLYRGERHDMPLHGHTSVGKHLGRPDVKEGLFIVVATPIEEVGRDHDFDWAVIEPSSSQSIVQTAGRVRRHRPGGTSRENVAVLQFNFKECRSKRDRGPVAVFTRPGNEPDPAGGQIWDHDLGVLLDWRELGHGLDARLRFESDLHRFSRLDDQAMKDALADPIRRMIENPALWLSKFSYEGNRCQWCLRDRQPSDTWRYSIEDVDNPRNGTWSRLENHGGTWGFHEAHPDQAKWESLSGEGFWFNVPLQGIIDFALKNNLTREWALEVDIKRYVTDAPYNLKASWDGIVAESTPTTSP